MATKHTRENVAESGQVLLAYIVNYCSAHHGKPPSFDDIRHDKNWQYADIRYVLAWLAEQGVVTVGRKYRDIEVVGSMWYPPEDWESKLGGFYESE